LRIQSGHHAGVFALLQNDHVSIIDHFPVHNFLMNVLRTIIAITYWSRVYLSRASFARVHLLFAICLWRLRGLLLACFVNRSWLVRWSLRRWWLVNSFYGEGWTLFSSCFNLNNYKLKW
jgi:hypothetical protein